MSYPILLHALDNNERRQLEDDLTIEVIQPVLNKTVRSYQPPAKHVYALELIDGVVYVPLAYALEKQYIHRSEWPSTQMNTFNITWRDYQLDIVKSTEDILLNQFTVVISLHVGWGKTLLAIHMAVKLGLKTLILTHSNNVLVQQWKQEISSTGNHIQVLNTKTKSLDENASFYVCNALVLPKLKNEHIRTQLRTIGFLIADEVHLLCSPILSRAFYYTQPKYAMALSATPYRQDGLDKLIDLHFGVHRVGAKLNSHHTVKCIKTGIRLPATDDWNLVLTLQSEHIKRNEYIARMVCSDVSRNYLVLCKRLNHIDALYTLLETQYSDMQSVVKLTGESNISLDDLSNSKVILTTIKKAGTGFSLKHLDTLILAADVEAYYIQYLGRVFRQPDKAPIIYDLVDNQPSLKKHWNARRQIYIASGGTLDVINVDIETMI